jgi:hypothetical protein
MLKEVQTMWNEPTKEQLAKIPKLYETEKTPLKDKLIYLHFFIGGCNWYIAEFDGEDLFWGYAILNGDLDMAEWGYVRFKELKHIKIPPGFEIDCEQDWKVRKASQIEKIRMGNHWQEKEELNDNC